MMTFNITTNVAFAGKKMSVDRDTLTIAHFDRFGRAMKLLHYKNLKNITKIDVYSMQVNE